MPAQGRLAADRTPTAHQGHTDRAATAIITIDSLHAALGSEPRLCAPGYERSAQTCHTTKGAILNPTRALACELAQHDITMHCSSPGQIPKPTLDAFTRQNFRNRVPLQCT
jgi:NAD(P)-dependent dehydrogenase (short-subunit alcohol dehydrogenase family)